MYSNGPKKNNRKGRSNTSPIRGRSLPCARRSRGRAPRSGHIFINEVSCSAPMSGLAMASTSHGTWVVPCRRALWIPAGVRHDDCPNGRRGGNAEVSTRAQVCFTDMPHRCRVVAISSLMRSLMAEAVALPIRYDLEGRSGTIMKLIGGYEVSRLRELCPCLYRCPRTRLLHVAASSFQHLPRPMQKIDDWASSLSLHLTRRTFTRLFRRETGLSFVAWRQQACILAALPKLTAGATVTQTAADLGYDNPAAFSTLFKRTLSVAPREYIQSIDRPWEGSTRLPAESDL